MGKKCSQLRRFKESLASITRPGGPTKRRQKTFSEKDPERADKLKAIEGQFNTFDTKFTRSKHEVFGRKVKGKTGKPAANKELSEQRRKNALIKERQRANRAGGVNDRRFGENDPNLDPEEQMLERFAREKQSRNRNSALYNLEDNVQLTHFGQSLAQMDDFDQGDLLNVSDDNGHLDEPVVVRPTEWPEQTRAEQESESEPVKTKAEVMSELIAKSKAYKHERQQQHEEDDEEIDKLDAKLPTLQSLLQTVPQYRPRVEKTAEMLSYDEAIREMVYDKRSKPAERTKTEEEIAQEESERLQKLEQDRLRRMRGEDVEEEGVGGRREGDDLDDDFVPEAGTEDFYGFGKGAAELEDEGQEDEAMSTDEDLPDDVEPPSDPEDESEEEEEDDDDFDIAQYFTDEETGEIPGVDPENSEDDIIPSTKRLRVQEPTTTSAELAYTFPCPATFDELHDILKDVPTPSIPIVIERIEILHSTKLLAENRQKLETFTPLVLKLILDLAAQKPAPLKTIQALMVRLKGLVTQFPSVLTTEVFAALEGSRKRFSNSMAGEKVFPMAQELVLFLTVGQLYPTSDLVHVVVNPAMLFMGQVLGQMKIRGIQDLARGLFVATLFLQFQSLSKRYVPEVLNFLNFTAVELSGVKAEGIPETRSTKHASLSMSPKSMPKTLPTKPSFDSLFADSVNEPEYKLQVFGAALELIEAASETWKSYQSFTEIFHPTTTILNTITTTKLFTALPAEVQTKFQTLLTTLQRRSKLLSGSRVPLTLQFHRPIPIPTYLPRFSMSHSFDSKNDPNHARSALNKLKAVHRQERKGVIRELRKEARTEAVVRSEEGQRRDKIYEERMKVAVGIMRGGNDVGKWERDQKRKRK